MKVVQKISIVAGDLLQPRLLKMVECLRTDYEIQIFSFNDTQKIGQYTTGIKLRLFEHVSDMPGYMRDLEKELESSDLIIGVGTSKLSTFQAIRVASKNDIPCAVFENEFQPYFYSEYPNIHAIQTDVYEKASFFFPSTEMAANTLRLVGVEESKIQITHPAIDTKRFCKNIEARNKFRNYIGIPDNAKTVLFHDELEPWTQPIEVLNTLKLLNSIGLQGAGEIHVLFVGNGSLANDLKYRAVDSGFGRRVMFLHQDPEPFLSDLYNASDITLVPRKQKCEFHEPYPLHILEMMACGVVPFVPMGTISAEIVGDAGVKIADDSYQTTSVHMRDILSDPIAMKKAVAKAVAHIGENYTTISIEKDFSNVIDSLVENGREQREAGFDYAEAISNLKKDIIDGAEQDVFVKIEELLLRDIPQECDRSEVLRLKGDAYSSCSSYDEAIDSYTESLHINAKNSKSYRGLGYIAWQGHSHEEAMTFFRKALMIDENDQKTLLGIALVYRRLSLYEESLFWLEKCVILDETNSTVLAALSQTCLDCPNPSLPIEVMERVLDSIGDNKRMLMTLGQLYMNDGKADLGSEILQKAMGSSEGTPAASA